jgi:hypothetical protein
MIKKLKFWKRHDLLWADGTIFMTRYTLLKLKSFSLKIHRFRRGDEEIHDHPWPFVSLVVWRSYMEVTPQDAIKRGWLSLRYRPAQWAHKVCVEQGKDAWTICATFGRAREWGFLSNGQWIQHDDYRRNNGRAKVTT